MLNLDFWNSVEPADLFQSVSAEENRKYVVRVLRSLTPDRVWTNIIAEQVEAGHIEVRCFVSWLARKLQPRAYLEVGVRRGFSIAMVAAQCPEAEIYGFDSWTPNYSNVENPGSRFVQSEMERIGYRKKVHLIDGNSHETLPVFFEDKAEVGWKLRKKQEFVNKPDVFELITIDGDHSLLGAYQDLKNVMPHCAIGGVVIFDDIAPDLSILSPTDLEIVRRELGEDPYGWGSLLGVWRAIQQQFSNFRYFEYTKNSPGAGLAVRLS